MEEVPPSEAQAESFLIEAESCFEANMLEEAIRLYNEASLLFTKISGTAKSAIEIELLFAKAAYCDFMKSYCEALEHKKNVERALMAGSHIDPGEISKLKYLVKMAEKCLREAIMRLEKVRKKAGEDEDIIDAVAEFLEMIKRKLDSFKELKDYIEFL